MRRPEAFSSIGSGNMTSPNQVPEMGVKSHIDSMLKILSSTQCPTQSTLKKVFGVPLKDVIAQQKNENKIPFIIKRICEYLENNGLHYKGIFRISGHSKTVEALRMSFEINNDANLEETNDVIAAANLLKIFFRELPESIIPENFLSQFIQLQADNPITDSEDYICHMKKLVEQLPEENFLTLRYLMSFLTRVAANAGDNCMTPLALGIVFGPNIFRIPDSIEGLHMTKAVNEIVTTFIARFSSVFETDSEVKKADPINISVVTNDDISVGELELDDGEKSEDSLSSSSSQKDGCYTDINDSFSDPATVGSPESDSDISSSSTTTTSPNIAVVSHDFVEMAISKTHNKSNLGISKDSIKQENTSANGLKSNSEDSNFEAKFKSSEKERKKPGNDSNQFPKLFITEPVEAVVSIGMPDEKRQTWKGNGDEDFHQSKRSVERSQVFQRLSSSKVRKTRKNVRKSHSLGDLKDEFGIGDDDSLKENENHDIPESQHKHLHKMGHKKAYAFHHKEGCMSLSLDFDPTNDRPSHPFLELHPQVQTKEWLSEESQSPSPSTTRKPYLPPLDLSILHEHGDGDEPIPTNRMRASWPLSRTETKIDEVMLSPRTSQLKNAENIDYLDPSIPPSPPVEQDAYIKNVTVKDDEVINSVMKELNKRIYCLKKQIRQFEESFEQQHGYKPSHADKMAQSSIKKCMSELSKARKDMKQLREDALKAGLAPYIRSHNLENPEINFKFSMDEASGSSSSNSHKRIEHNESERLAMEDSLEEMMNILAEKRRLANRPEDLREMDSEQVQDEKVAIQKSLLHYESIFGRPTTRTEKDLMKPMYDRYRNVKRLLSKQSSAKSKDQGTELQPILEHEAMDFIQTSPQHRSDLEKEGKQLNNQHNIPQTSAVEIVTSIESENECKNLYDSGSSASSHRNLHELSIRELLEQHQKVKGEKKRMRRVLREFENEFQRQAGRRVQREDRAPLEAVYSEYKQVKAKLRLLEALLSKHNSRYTI